MSRGCPKRSPVRSVIEKNIISSHAQTEVSCASEQLPDGSVWAIRSVRTSHPSIWCVACSPCPSPYKNDARPAHFSTKRYIAYRGYIAILRPLRPFRTATSGTRQSHNSTNCGTLLRRRKKGKLFLSRCLSSSSLAFIPALPFPFTMSGEEDDERRGCGDGVMLVVDEKDDWWDGGAARRRTCAWRPWGGGDEVS